MYLLAESKMVSTLEIKLVLLKLNVYCKCVYLCGITKNTIKIFLLNLKFLSKFIFLMVRNPLLWKIGPVRSCHAIMLAVVNQLLRLS